MWLDLYYNIITTRIINQHGCTFLPSANEPLTTHPCWTGSLAEWLADHPVMIGGILPMVLQGLGKPELSVSSVSTLKRICRECRHDLAPYAPDILTTSQVRLKENTQNR